ncbi:MAG TPA: hypothetical protein VGP26_12270 [Actinophytocola sp.]|jgi:hypothetical protein|nr:hypothetical protein [Actinophytocola sp.]
MRSVPLRGVCLLVVLPLLGLTVACGGRPGAEAGRVLAAQRGPAPPASRPATTAARPAPKPKPKPKKPRTTKRPTPPVSGDLLRKAAAGMEPGTTLGAAVFDRVTGKSPLEYNADRGFRSASLVKLLIAIDVLERGAGVADRQRVARMLTMSDDGLASMFWVRDGGPELVTHLSAELGLSGVRPPEVPGRWGEVVVTPHDVVAVYRYVLRLPPPDRALIVTALGQAPRVAADGFDQHFGIPDGLDAQWAVKQGWGSNDRARVLHSTGLVGPGFRYVVVLLTEHPLGSGWPACARSLTAAASALHGTMPGL